MVEELTINNKGLCILDFQGDINYFVIGDILKSYQKEIIIHQLGIGKEKKLFGLLVEILENINKHSYFANKDERGDYKPFVKLYKEDENFSLFSGNFIENVNVPALSDKIEFVNKLDITELKKLYNSTSAHKEFL